MLSRDVIDLVHDLNQRYRGAWDRAERLQAELDNIHGSRAWRVLSWLRRFKAWFLRSRSVAPPPRFSARFLDDMRVVPTGRVSIVVPFQDQPGLLKNLLVSLRRSTYRDYEVVLVDNGSTYPRTLRLLDRLARRRRCRVIACPGPFNFARLCNAGAGQGTGDYLLFLNNDIEVITADWLERMLELAGHPEVGVVGATLLYPDGSLQHAGIALDESGQWAHLHRGRPADFSGERGELLRPRAVPAVTGACLLIRRDRFEELRRFDERLPVTGNDVDLCCRARSRGWLVAVTPHARLLHFESLSRGYERLPPQPASPPPGRSLPRS